VSHPPTPSPPSAGPRLAVETTVDDLEHLTLVALRRSPSHRRTLLAVRALSALLVLGAGAFLSHVDLGWGAMVLFVPAAAFAAWWAPRGVLRTSVRRTLATMAQDPSGSVLGPREFELLPDQLVERWPNGESRHALRTLHDVVHAPGGTLVFVGPLTAYVLPRERVLAGDHQAFVDALVAAWEAARARS
jgi:hypothetical protein